MTETTEKKSTNHRVEIEDSIIKAIDDWNKGAYGYAPSFRDVSALASAPLGTVHRICRILREEGKITYVNGVARTLRVTGGNHGN